MTIRELDLENLKQLQKAGKIDILSPLIRREFISRIINNL